MSNMSSEEIDRYLRGANYPADKFELVNYAKIQRAPEDLMRKLERLPNQTFNSPEDVRKNIGEGSSRSGMGSIGMKSRY